MKSDYLFSSKFAYGLKLPYYVVTRARNIIESIIFGNEKEIQEVASSSFLYSIIMYMDLN